MPFAWSPRSGDSFIDMTPAGLKAAMGIFTGTTPNANGTTPVAVANANVTAASVITLTLRTAGGTPGGAVVVSKTAGTGFSFAGVAGDTSTYSYEIRT